MGGGRKTVGVRAQIVEVSLALLNVAYRALNILLALLVGAYLFGGLSVSAMALCEVALLGVYFLHQGLFKNRGAGSQIEPL